MRRGRTMPVPPAEVTAEITLESGSGSIGDLVEAAGASGLAVDVGPGVTGLSGDKDRVVQALVAVLEAAIESGARSVHIDLQIPEARSRTE
jgi:uncharacterized protein YqgV (UPF0045/DUF77 family)